MLDARGWFALGALGAAVVTIVFATVGDGVDAGDGPVATHGHTAVWLLLALALGIAAVVGRWQRVSGGLAVAALVVYALFLLTVLG